MISQSSNQYDDELAMQIWMKMQENAKILHGDYLYEALKEIIPGLHYIDWAEKCIAEMQREFPEHHADLAKAFPVLFPSPAIYLFPKHWYMLHCRELLLRVIYQTDTRLLTVTEIMGTLTKITKDNKAWPKPVASLYFELFLIASENGSLSPDFCWEESQETIAQAQEKAKQFRESVPPEEIASLVVYLQKEFSFPHKVLPN